MSALDLPPDDTDARHGRLVLAFALGVLVSLAMGAFCLWDARRATSTTWDVHEIPGVGTCVCGCTCGEGR